MNGPATRPLISMAKFIARKRLPAWPSSRCTRPVSTGSTAPSTAITTPKKNMPLYAARPSHSTRTVMAFLWSPAKQILGEYVEHTLVVIFLHTGHIRRDKSHRFHAFGHQAPADLRHQGHGDEYRCHSRASCHSLRHPDIHQGIFGRHAVVDGDIGAIGERFAGRMGGASHAEIGVRRDRDHRQALLLRLQRDFDWRGI